MKEKEPILESLEATYYQESDTMDPDSEGRQALKVWAESGIGEINDKNCRYLVFKTDRWAIKTVDELKRLFERFEKMLDTDNESNEIDMTNGQYDL